MKIEQTPRALRGIAVTGFALFMGTLQAAPFLYSSGDLVLAIRQTGAASDYVVNIGKATNYNALPTGSSATITNLSQTELTAAFPSLNDLKWSVAGANRPPGDTNYPLQTIWVSALRQDKAVQSAAWLRKGQFVQGTVASQIDAIGANAVSASSSQVAGPDNTATGVVIPTTSLFAFDPVIGDAGDFAGTFQGRAEAVTADDFDNDPTNVSRADLYELLPGSSASGTLNAPGRYLGYFELKPDGALSFNTGAPPIPAPVISGISRAGDVTTISFLSTANVQYHLRAATLAQLSDRVSEWANGATIVGNGATQTLQDTNSDHVRFFVIEIQP